jgi:hypothetical protein
LTAGRTARTLRIADQLSPSDITRIPATRSLPDLFTFFGPGRGARVTRPGEWAARAAELSDLMQYYLYGYKQPTPESALP